MNGKRSVNATKTIYQPEVTKDSLTPRQTVTKDLLAQSPRGNNEGFTHSPTGSDEGCAYSPTGSDDGFAYSLAGGNKGFATFAVRCRFVCIFFRLFAVRCRFVRRLLPVQLPFTAASFAVRCGVECRSGTRRHSEGLGVWKVD